MTDFAALAEAIERDLADLVKAKTGSIEWYLIQEDRHERLDDLETAYLELWARVQELEGRKLRLEGRLWSIGHAAGCETREDLMRSALDMLPQPPETTNDTP